MVIDGSSLSDRKYEGAMMNHKDALEKIYSTEEYEQVLALAALGKIGTVDDLHHIVPLITKCSFEIKHIAAGVASSIIRVNLLEKYEDQSEETRDKLGMLLSRLTPDLVLEIGRDIHREDGMIRDNAIRLLRHLTCTPSVKEMLRTLLTSDQKRVRVVALEVIDSFKGGVGHEILLQWIRARDDRTRANAVEVIEHLGDITFIDLLYQLKNDPNNRVRANVLKALHVLTNKRIFQDLIKMLDSDQPRMQASALWLISHMEDTDDYTLCDRAVRLLHHPDLSVVNNAVHALRNFTLESAKAALIKAGYHD